MTGPLDPPPNDDQNLGWAPPPAPQPEWQPGPPTAGYLPQQPPPPAYPHEQEGHSAPPVAEVARDRAQRFAARPQPTIGTTLAGVGMGLVVFGVIIWSGSYAVSGVAQSFDGGGSSGTRTWLGIVLSLGVTLLGYTLAAISRRGPIATAGVAASALGIPTALVFITLDFTSGSPINVDAVFVVSIVVWLLSYTWIPGARGHGFYLGLSAVAIWIYLIIKISPSLPGLPGDLASRALLGSGVTGGDPTNDLSSLTVMSFLLAIAYYGIAFGLDRSGKPGAATPLVAAGFPVTVGALLFAANDFGLAGEGVALIVIGYVLVLYGARARRRFTAWAWGLGMLVGVFLLIAKASPDNDTAAGILFIVSGVVLTGIGVLASNSLGEREYPGS